MPHWLRSPIITLGIVAAGCGGSLDPPGQQLSVGNVTSPTEFVLAIGGEVKVDAQLRIGFRSVPSDSRCPSSVTCVWAGDGAAEIAYGTGTGPLHPDTLHTALDPKQVEFGGYLIKLLELNPYPSTPAGIRQEDYRLRLRVERRP